MTARVFLAIAGVLYAGLGIWCTLAPKSTSRKVGFSLEGDSGMSEFITVYGGLEVGLALIFLLPLYSPEATRYSLLSCLLVHACLVIFRAGSLLLHRDFGPFTLKLAAGEWIIFLAALAIWFFRKPA